MSINLVKSGNVLMVAIPGIYMHVIFSFIINELTQFYVYSWCYLGRVFSTKKLCIPPGSCQLDDGTIVKNGETVFPNTPCIGMYEYIYYCPLHMFHEYLFYIYIYVCSLKLLASAI